MTERTFRLILGGALILALYLDSHALMYAYLAALLFEGITNYRIPLIVSRLRGGKMREEPAHDVRRTRINFETERALRLIIATLIVLSFVVFHEGLWFVPWFIGFSLVMAGITGICPMAILLTWMGFR